MKVYELIETYPGSPDLGSIINEDVVDHYPRYFDIETGKRYNTDEVESFPRFWQEIIKEYPRVLSFRCKSSGKFVELHNNGLYCCKTCADYKNVGVLTITDLLKDLDQEIYQVALAENLTYTIGERVLNGYDCDFIITKFRFYDDMIICNGVDTIEYDINIINKVQFDWYVKQYFKKDSLDISLASNWCNTPESMSGWILRENYRFIPFELRIGLLKFICDELEISYRYVINAINTHLISDIMRKICDICWPAFLESFDDKVVNDNNEFLPTAIDKSFSILETNEPIFTKKQIEKCIDDYNKTKIFINKTLFLQNLGIK
jgi:hypothetical protein